MSDKEPFGFIVCMPFSRCPPETKSIRAACVLCGGDVGINPRNTFDKDVPVILKPLCGACMVSLADGGEEVDDIRCSTHLPDGVKNWVAEVVEQEGAMKFVELIRARIEEFRADNPKGGTN